MENEFERLKQGWEEAKKGRQVLPVNASVIIEQAKAREKASIYFHYGNMMVLTIVAIAIVVYFAWLFPFNALLSKIGVGCMLAGLIVRITGEFQSVRKFIKINIAHAVAASTDEYIGFLQYRKKIHGIFTYITVSLYTIGFFLLYPEIYDHFGIKIILFLTGFYVLAAGILIAVIRPNIKKEMKDLTDIVELKNELIKTE